jgi:hypothetical protein
LIASLFVCCLFAPATIPFAAGIEAPPTPKRVGFSRAGVLRKFIPLLKGMALSGPTVQGAPQSERGHDCWAEHQGDDGDNVVVFHLNSALRLLQLL